MLLLAFNQDGQTRLAPWRDRRAPAAAAARAKERREGRKAAATTTAAAAVAALDVGLEAVRKLVERTNGQAQGAKYAQQDCERLLALRYAAENAEGLELHEVEPL